MLFTPSFMHFLPARNYSEYTCNWSFWPLSSPLKFTSQIVSQAHSMGIHFTFRQYDIFASSHPPCDWQATPVLEEKSGRLIFGKPHAQCGVDNITQPAGNYAAIPLKSSRGSLKWMRLQCCSGPICSHLPHSRRTEGMLTARFCTLMKGDGWTRHN